MNEGRFTYWVMGFSILGSIVATLVFLSNPSIDLQIEKYFFDAGAGFTFNQYDSIFYTRRAILFGYGAWYATITIFAIYKFSYSPPSEWTKSGTNITNFSFSQWLYLAIASLAGPLLLANIILKNNWGRARPREIELFGGSQEFSPPLYISDQCDTNCSFISGEPSSMFMLFISLAFILPGHRILFVFLTLLFGSLSGIMRMGQGGHFLSDVIFAGLFMSLVAGVVYWLMFLAPRKSKNA